MSDTPDAGSDSRITPTILYRPIGAAELALIAAADFRAFPPRLAHQPIFCQTLERHTDGDRVRLEHEG